MDLERAHYIIRSFPRLLSENERAAQKHYQATFKIGSADKYESPEVYEDRLSWWKEGNYISEDPDVLNLLSHGLQQFYIKTASRIVEDSADKIFFNYCPSCKSLARTPYARQCKHCGYTWHNTIASNFKMRKIFELELKPKELFFAGEIKSGIIKQGMKIDLTFLGVAVKPEIKSIDYMNHISEGRSEVVLSADVDNDEEKDYLLKRGVLAIPVIIEV